MRELVLSCDVHFQEDHGRRHVPAETVVVALGDTPRELDLCEECIAVLVKPLADVMARHGSTLDIRTGPAMKNRTGSCPKPDCDSHGKWLKDLAGHGRNVHGWSALVLRHYLDHGYTEAGRRTNGLVSEPHHQCTECGRTFENAYKLSQHFRKDHEPDLPCPECETAGTPYMATTAQGLGAHRRVKHGVTGKSPGAVAQRELRASA